MESAKFVDSYLGQSAILDTDHVHRSLLHVFCHIIQKNNIFSWHKKDNNVFVVIIMRFTPNLWHVIRLIRVVQQDLIGCVKLSVYFLTNESSVPCMPSSSHCVLRLFSKHPGQAPMALVLPSGIFQLLTYAQKFLPHLAMSIRIRKPRSCQNRILSTAAMQL